MQVKQSRAVWHTLIIHNPLHFITGNMNNVCVHFTNRIKWTGLSPSAVWNVGQQHQHPDPQTLPYGWLLVKAGLETNRAEGIWKNTVPRQWGHLLLNQLVGKLCNRKIQAEIFQLPKIMNSLFCFGNKCTVETRITEQGRQNKGFVCKGMEPLLSGQGWGSLMCFP